jgi:hypothetical protein
MLITSYSSLEDYIKQLANIKSLFVEFLWQYKHGLISIAEGTIEEAVKEIQIHEKRIKIIRTYEILEVFCNCQKKRNI